MDEDKMANPTALCPNVDHLFLSPPHAEALDDLHLSTVSLLANASSNPSHNCSNGSLDRLYDSSRPISANYQFPLYPYSSDEELNCFNRSPKYGSCSQIFEVTTLKKQQQAENQSKSGGPDWRNIKRQRQNSASPKIPTHARESKPPQFREKMSDMPGKLPQPIPCYGLRVDVTDVASADMDSQHEESKSS